MKIFLSLLALFVLLAGGAWYYFDSTMHYLPPDVETMQEVRPEDFHQQARQIKKRMSRELKAGGQTSVSAGDIEKITFAAIARKSKIPPEELIKRYKVDIQPEGVRLSALVDLRKVRQLRLPAKMRTALETVTGFIPDDMLDEVYVSVNGLPQKVGDKVAFSDDARVQIGGWSRKLNDLMDDARIILGRDIFQKLSFNTIRIEKARVIIKRQDNRP